MRHSLRACPLNLSHHSDQVGSLVRVHQFTALVF